MVNCFLSASPNPCLVMMPAGQTSPAITMVAISEKSNPHSRAYPNLASAIEQVVMVPGPIKAAVTIAPRPNLNLKVFS